MVRKYLAFVGIVLMLRTAGDSLKKLRSCFPNTNGIINQVILIVQKSKENVTFLHLKTYEVVSILTPNKVHCNLKILYFHLRALVTRTICTRVSILPSILLDINIISAILPPPTQCFSLQLQLVQPKLPVFCPEHFWPLQLSGIPPFPLRNI